jgi:branched-chain amino acid transport system ATP-binding protein
MTDARLVLLDEPGAGVNPTLMRRIMEMITRLNRERGYTFCIIEHDMDLIAELCDPVIVLATGRVLTVGTMAEVRADERVIDAYFGGEVVA